MKNNKFHRWFVSQHLDRPSKLEISELMDAMSAKQKEVDALARLIRECQDWHIQYKSALLAWKARAYEDALHLWNERKHEDEKD
jgi:hypothetical protein